MCGATVSGTMYSMLREVAFVVLSLAGMIPYTRSW
jgi:hypothetical protein